MKKLVSPAITLLLLFLGSCSTDPDFPNEESLIYFLYSTVFDIQ